MMNIDKERIGPLITNDCRKLYFRRFVLYKNSHVPPWLDWMKHKISVSLLNSCIGVITGENEGAIGTDPTKMSNYSIYLFNFQWKRMNDRLISTPDIRSSGYGLQHVQWYIDGVLLFFGNLNFTLYGYGGEILKKFTYSKLISKILSNEMSIEVDRRDNINFNLLFQQHANPTEFYELNELNVVMKYSMKKERNQKIQFWKFHHQLKCLVVLTDSYLNLLHSKYQLIFQLNILNKKSFNSDRRFSTSTTLSGSTNEKQSSCNWHSMTILLTSNHTDNYSIEKDESCQLNNDVKKLTEMESEYELKSSSSGKELTILLEDGEKKFYICNINEFPSSTTIRKNRIVDLDEISVLEKKMKNENVLSIRSYCQSIFLLELKEHLIFFNPFNFNNKNKLSIEIFENNFKFIQSIENDSFFLISNNHIESIEQIPQILYDLSPSHKFIEIFEETSYHERQKLVEEYLGEKNKKQNLTDKKHRQQIYENSLTYIIHQLIRLSLVSENEIIYKKLLIRTAMMTIQFLNDYTERNHRRRILVNSNDQISSTISINYFLSSFSSLFIPITYHQLNYYGGVRLFLRLLCNQNRMYLVHSFASSSQLFRLTIRWAMNRLSDTHHMNERILSETLIRQLKKHCCGQAPYAELAILAKLKNYDEIMKKLLQEETSVTKKIRTMLRFDDWKNALQTAAESKDIQLSYSVMEKLKNDNRPIRTLLPQMPFLKELYDQRWTNDDNSTFNSNSSTTTSNRLSKKLQHLIKDDNHIAIINQTDLNDFDELFKKLIGDEIKLVKNTKRPNPLDRPNRLIASPHHNNMDNQLIFLEKAKNFIRNNNQNELLRLILNMKRNDENFTIYALIDWMIKEGKSSDALTVLNSTHSLTDEISIDGRFDRVRCLLNLQKLTEGTNELFSMDPQTKEGQKLKNVPMTMFLRLLDETKRISYLHMAFGDPSNVAEAKACFERITTSNKQ
ncbi:hypothetical protein SNEBB_002712 [Seison nebaliae]|nr:hypothetical protein SNEBB_002712 [Seison nebaliae]